MNPKSTGAMLSDAQIAELLLLGIESNGGKAAQQREAIRKLYEGLESRISSFRENFETALEEELLKAERDKMLEVILALSNNSLSKILGEDGYAKKLESIPYGHTRIDSVVENDGLIHLDVKVELYAGRGYRGSGEYNLISRNDAKYFKSILDRSKTITLEAVYELYLKRKGYPKIVSLTQPVKLPSGETQYFTHLVEAIYTVQIPKSILPEIYVKHKSQL